MRGGMEGWGGGMAQASQWEYGGGGGGGLVPHSLACTCTRTAQQPNNHPVNYSHSSPPEGRGVEPLVPARVGCHDFHGVERAVGEAGHLHLLAAADVGHGQARQEHQALGLKVHVAGLQGGG